MWHQARGGVSQREGEAMDVEKGVDPDQNALI